MMMTMSTTSSDSGATHTSDLKSMAWQTHTRDWDNDDYYVNSFPDCIEDVGDDDDVYS